jgi:hypothetical protein
MCAARHQTLVNALRVVALLFAMGLAGCVTPPGKMPDFKPEVSRKALVRIGNVEGRTTFEAVFARSAKAVGAIDLYKGGPAPVLRLRVLPDGRGFVEGPQNARWSGQRMFAPAPLRPLLTMAAVYADESKLPEGSREVHSQNMRIAVDVDDGKIRAISAASATSVATAVFD